MSLDRSSDEDEDRCRAFSDVVDAWNALGTARIRTQPTEMLIRGLTDPNDPANYYVCQALADRELAPEHRNMVASQVRVALSDGFRRGVNVSGRGKLDRMLLHTAALMERPDAREIAQTQLVHRLAARRRVAVRVLHRLGLESSDLQAARNALVEYGEAEAISILAALPAGLSDFDCCSLIRLSDECPNPPFGDNSYLGAVALEGLAKGGLLDHQHACSAHPVYYVRAVGRMKDPALEGFLRMSVEAGGVKVLPMAVSVAGRLQLTDLLTALEAEIALRVEKDRGLYSFLRAN